MSNKAIKDLTLSSDLVSVYVQHNNQGGVTSYRLRWYDATKKQISLSIKNKGSALALAMQITQDITNGFYHPRDYYDPKKSLEKQAIDTQYQNLHFLWNQWEELDHQYSHTSLLTHRRIRQVLTLVKDDSLTLDNAHNFLTEYRRMYADGTIYRDMAVIIACVNYWVKVGKVRFNPYPAIKSMLKPKKNEHDNKGRFTSIEIGWLLPQFEKLEHCPYFDLVKFLFMTGLRPQEAIPLTWGDIHWASGKILIAKTYSKGELRGNTKQGKKDKIVHRKYVMDSKDDGVWAFLLSLYGCNCGDDSLIFPSPNNTFIDWGNFTRRHWQPIITKLVAEKKVRKYLKPYCMRHTFITNEINKKTPLHIIAQQCGTSIEMIVETYLIGDDWEIDRSGYDDYVREYSK